MESIAQRRLLLLDLDGTLVDTLSFLFECFRQAVAPLVKRLPTDQEVVATFGPSEEECIGRLLRDLEARGMIDGAVRQEDICRSAERFHALYEAGHDDGEVPLYPHMKEIVEEFRCDGWATGIFTGKGRASALSTLEHHHLVQLFDTVITSDDVRCPKPASDGVLLAIKQVNSSPELTIFVGDNPNDILAGRAAGVTTVAAMWGAFNRKETLAAGPQLAFESPSDLRLLLRH